MRKAKIFTIFLGVSLLTVSAVLHPQVKDGLHAEEDASNTMKGSSYAR